ncbi:hypothetical protein [Soonwooa sp.]|uniref:hypothetical protein n=1 Tax=Soonwooa sp. TaxID=1938592 RepID=UPI0028A9F00B|nr:hypothetical protein [Soonwooa sp.]
MQNNYKEYLYYDGEEENPFTDEQSRELRKDVFWHYEKLHFFAKQNDDSIFTVKGYIKNILVHSLDEDKPTLPHYQLYLNNSPK